MAQLIKCLPYNHEDLSLIFCSLVKAEWTWWIMPIIPAIRGESRRIGSRSSSNNTVSVRPYLQKQNKTKIPVWKLVNRFSQNTFSKKYSESSKGRHNIWPPYLQSSTNMGMGTHKIDKVKWSRPPHASIYIYISTNVHIYKNTTYYFTQHCAIAH